MDERLYNYSCWTWTRYWISCNICYIPIGGHLWIASSVFVARHYPRKVREKVLTSYNLLESPKTYGGWAVSKTCSRSYQLQWQTIAVCRRGTIGPRSSSSAREWHNTCCCPRSRPRFTKACSGRSIFHLHLERIQPRRQKHCYCSTNLQIRYLLPACYKG